MPHHILRIPIPRNLRRFDLLANLCLLFLRQLDIQTPHILIKILHLRRPGLLSAKTSNLNNVDILTPVSE